MPEGVVQCTPCRRVPPPSGRRDPPCGFPAWGMSCRAPRRAAGSPPGLCAPAFLDAAADPPSPRPTCRRPPAGNRRPSTGPGTLAPRLGGQGPSVGAPMVQALTAASAKANEVAVPPGLLPGDTARRSPVVVQWSGRGRRPCAKAILRDGTAVGLVRARVCAKVGRIGVCYILMIETYAATCAGHALSRAGAVSGETLHTPHEEIVPLRLSWEASARNPAWPGGRQVTPTPAARARCGTAYRSPAAAALIAATMPVERPSMPQNRRA